MVICDTDFERRYNIMKENITPEVIKKRAWGMRTAYATESQPFNAYAYLMKHSKKAWLVNLPIDLPAALFVWRLSGRRLILINEKADISLNDLNRLLVNEISKIELDEHATDANVEMFTNTLLNNVSLDGYL